MPHHYSEVIRIIEGGLRGDVRKVIAYSNLLADKIEEDGDLSTAERIRKVASGNAGLKIIPLTTQGQTAEAEAQMEEG